jgi:hypothetical protein
MINIVNSSSSPAGFLCLFYYAVLTSAAFDNTGI